MIDVLIIAYNESINLPHCLASLEGWVERVIVVDSGSDDGTVEIAREHGAEVVHQDWRGYSRQRNWALDHLDLASDWTLVLDADEAITPALRDELLAITQRPPGDVPENGFFINRLTYFLDRPIRHCGYFPSWNLRLFKRGLGRYEHRSVHEHLVIDDPVGYIHEPMLHRDRRGLEHFYAKHNRYSTLESEELYREITGLKSRPDRANLTGETRRRRWLKRHVIRHLPLPGFWRFLYMYVFRLGFIDGVAGYNFCRFIGNYDGMVAFKLRVLLRQNRAGHAVAVADGGASAEPTSGLARVVEPAGSGPGPPPADAAEDPGGALVNATEVHQMAPEASPWSFRGKLVRALWMLLGKPLFRMSFHNWYGYRRVLLRLFGARIGRNVRVRPTVNIEIPWQLRIDRDAVIGDFAILYSLGRVTIGARTIISQYAHLCAGTHDYRNPSFPLLRPPVTIGDDVWIGADAFVGPGVTVGRLAVLGARSSTYSDIDPGVVAVGNPARAKKTRQLK